MLMQQRQEEHPETDLMQQFLRHLIAKDRSQGVRPLCHVLLNAQEHFDGAIGILSRQLQE